jgi:hypothetical protein
MRIISENDIPRIVNLLIVGIICVINILTGLTPYFELWIAAFIVFLLVANSIVMNKFYKKHNIRFGNLLFIVNLILPIGLPFYRLVGTNFREGYIEILFISTPLILLILWNQKIKKTGYNKS